MLILKQKDYGMLIVFRPSWFQFKTVQSIYECGKCFSWNVSVHSLTVSTLRTLKSKNSVFSLSNWLLSNLASRGPGIVPSSPCTENLITVLEPTHINNRAQTQMSRKPNDTMRRPPIVLIHLNYNVYTFCKWRTCSVWVLHGGMHYG